MIKGKKIMDKLGYRSTIIVSSPYHMRRLQLIAGKVFGDDYQIGFQATSLFHVTRPRVSDVICGKTGKFTIDALVDMLERTGKHVTVQVH